MKQSIIEEAPWAKFLFNNTKASFIWLILRIYVGWQWLSAGWEKVHSVMWVGPSAGGALSGFINGAIAKTAGANPAVQGWYGSFLQTVVLPHVSAWSYAITYGELLVGVALIVGIFTGIAAFFGLFMNLNYLLAGTVSVNPILFTISIGLILAWRVAGFLGLDYWVLPVIGTSWHPGTFSGKQKQTFQ